MVEARGFTLEACAASHLETEEGTHGLLGGIGILLTLLLLGGRCRGGMGGYRGTVSYSHMGVGRGMGSGMRCGYGGLLFTYSNRGQSSMYCGSSL